MRERVRERKSDRQSEGMRGRESICISKIQDSKVYLSHTHTGCVVKCLCDKICIPVKRPDSLRGTTSLGRSEDEWTTGRRREGLRVGL